MKGTPAGERGVHRRLVAAVALLSAAALGYELLLLRVFSVMYWHHFAHLIISMALLGSGVSGVVLALLQGHLLPRFHAAYSVCASCFAIAVLASVAVAGRFAFHPPELIWDGRQVIRMAGVFVPAALPFFFSGSCIGLAMRRCPDDVGRIYRADLAGAALGALVLTVLLFHLPPEHALRGIALAGILSGVLIGGHRPVINRGVIVVAVVLASGWPTAWLVPVPSPFKDMSRTLLVPGVEIAAERQSPTGVFSALSPGAIPFRAAPGLSLLSPVGPPPQIALFHDGHAVGMVHGAGTGLAAAAFMRWTPMALPYVLAPSPSRVMIAGAGGGGDVLHALAEGAGRVDAVEPHSELIALVSGPLGGYAGDLYSHERVHVIRSDVRGFLAATAGPVYDLVQISPLGTTAPPAAGSGQALSAQYLYTVEGMRQAFSRLAPAGLLSISMELELPPRGMIKLLATLAEAMRREGVQEPAAHAVVVRAWNTVTLVCQRVPFSPAQGESVRVFCRERAFDPVWFPGMATDDVNRVNVLERPYLHEAALAVWDGRHGEAYHRFQLELATDDQPWFGRFFRWRALPSLWRQRTSGGAAMLEWETLLLWMALGFAVATSGILIGIPLVVLHSRQRQQLDGDGLYAAPLLYFAALGLAFLFLEIAFLHKFVLFLRHPMISMAVIVPSFLFFAGCGSGCAAPLARWLSVRGPLWLRDRPVTVAASAIVLFSVGYLGVLPLLFRVGAGWPDAIRVGVSILLISGPAFWMGMPFPLGIGRLGAHAPGAVPLAWGVNGFFSVISATGATVIALHGGFRMVVLAALGAYLLAASIERRL